MFLWRTGENYPRIIIKYSSLTSPLWTGVFTHKQNAQIQTILGIHWLTRIFTVIYHVHSKYSTFQLQNIHVLLLKSERPYGCLAMSLESNDRTKTVVSDLMLHSMASDCLLWHVSKLFQLFQLDVKHKQNHKQSWSSSDLPLVKEINDSYIYKQKTYQRDGLCVIVSKVMPVCFAVW